MMYRWSNIHVPLWLPGVTLDASVDGCGHRFCTCYFLPSPARRGAARAARVKLGRPTAIPPCHRQRQRRRHPRSRRGAHRAWCASSTQGPSCCCRVATWVCARSALRTCRCAPCAAPRWASRSTLRCPAFACPSFNSTVAPSSQCAQVRA